MNDYSGCFMRSSNQVRVGVIASKMEELYPMDNVMSYENQLNRVIEL